MNKNNSNLHIISCWAYCPSEKGMRNQAPENPTNNLKWTAQINESSTSTDRGWRFGHFSMH